MVRLAQHDQAHDLGLAVGKLVGVAVEGHLLFDVSIKIADILFLGCLLHADRKHVIRVDNQQDGKVASEDVLAKVALGQVQLQPRGRQAHGNHQDVVEVLGNDAANQNGADNQVFLLVVNTCLQLNLCTLVSRPKDIQSHKDEEHLTHGVVKPLVHGAIGDGNDNQQLAYQERCDGNDEQLLRMLVEQVHGNQPNKSLRSGRHKGPQHRHGN